MSFEPLKHTGAADFRLRPATNADGAAIRELVYSVLAEFGLAPDPAATDADLADLEANYPARGGRFDVLVDARGEIVGTVGLLPVEAGSVELRKMYLRPEFRNRGLGRLLLAHAVSAARELGFRRMTLETATVLQAAVRLYERHGFQPTVCAGAHSCRCDLVMARNLT